MTAEEKRKAWRKLADYMLWERRIHWWLYS